MLTLIWRRRMIPTRKVVVDDDDVDENDASHYG